MAKRPTREDVARLAGVSPSTVSYVVNKGPRSVSAATVERVHQAIQELGYRPHAIARSLRAGNTRTVGLLVASFLRPGLVYQVNAIQNSLAERDYALIISSSHEDSETERRMLDVMASQAIDGLLFIPAGDQNRDLVMEFIDNNVPVVFIDRTIREVPADTVMTDNVEAAREATEFLIGRGHRHIICISFSHKASSALDRVEGYQKAMQAHDLQTKAKDVLVVEEQSHEAAEAAVLAYVERHGAPEGVLCTTRTIAFGVVKAFRQLNLQMPDPLAIVGGFFQWPCTELHDPPLPVIEQDKAGMAQQAVEFLIDRMNGNDAPPRVVLLDAKLVIPEDQTK
jgi:DNA-binding LacI/PurR family transcriptional regulator